MNASISKEQAIEIARKRAIKDPYVMFKNPYVDYVERQPGTGHWLIKLLSSKPRPDVFGEMHMYIVVDKESGSIVSVDSGGGS